MEAGVDWYQDLFKCEGLHAFEASTNYSKRYRYPGVPERIYSLLPDIKLIYILRDPIAELFQPMFIFSQTMA